MIGIDTNVLLRLFTPEDDPQQAEAARKLIRTQSPVFLHPLVLAEFVWTLRRRYKYEHLNIRRMLASILSSDEFVVGGAESVGNAFVKYESGSADFADYMIGELNRRAGCETTATFDLETLLTPELFSPVKA